MGIRGVVDHSLLDDFDNAPSIFWDLRMNQGRSRTDNTTEVFSSSFSWWFARNPWNLLVWIDRMLRGGLLGPNHNLPAWFPASGWSVHEVLDRILCSVFWFLQRPGIDGNNRRKFAGDIPREGQPIVQWDPFKTIWIPLKIIKFTSIFATSFIKSITVPFSQMVAIGTAFSMLLLLRQHRQASLNDIFQCNYSKNLDKPRKSIKF
jgi:hypothetical protein